MSIEVDTEKIPLFNEDGDNPGYVETGEQFEMENLNPYDSSSIHRTDEETSFGGDISTTTDLIEKQRKIDEAWKIIKSKFPNANTVIHHLLLR